MSKKTLRLLIILFSPASLILIYDQVFYILPAIASLPLQPSSIISTLMIFGLQIFLAGLVVKSTNFTLALPLPPTMKTPPSKFILFFGSLLIYLSYFFLIIRYLSNNPGEQFFLAPHQHFFSASRNGGALQYFLMLLGFAVISAELFFSKIKYRHLLIGFLSILPFIFTGGRTVLACSAGVLLAITFVFHGFKVNKHLLILIVALGLSSFVFMTISRAGGIKEYFTRGATTLDFNNFQYLKETLAFQTKDNKSFLSFLEDYSFSMVPSSTWNHKPISTSETRLVWPEIAASGTNITTGIYANLLLNSPATLILLPFIFLGLQNLYFRIFPTSTPQYKHLILLTFFVFFPLVLRGGFLNIRLLINGTFILYGFLTHKILQQLLAHFRSTKVSKHSIN